MIKIKPNFLILLFYLIVNSCFAIETNIPTDIEVRKITPPKLEQKNIKRKILCYRPMRKNSPAMYIEKKNNKTIVHNYGHGGSGLTLAPGAAKYVIDLLEQQLGSSYKNNPVVVVGSGVIGLFSALELVNRSYSNVTILAADFEGLTSHNAGGLLAPASMDNDPKIQSLIDKIGVDAYNYYKKVALNKDPILKKGAKIMTTYFGTRETSSLEPYVRAKIMQPAKDVVLDFQNGTQRKMIAYDDGIFMDIDELLQELKRCLEEKVTFKKRRLQSLDEIETEVIINCTGLGAKELVNDSQVTSVQGHLILLKDQNDQDINYMMSVYVNGGTTESGFTVKRKCSLFPKKELSSPVSDVGVIGGTFIDGVDDTNPNLEQFAIEFDNARKFFGLTNTDASFFYN